jgi:biotin synthase-related radical SAM superfamily protein
MPEALQEYGCATFDDQDKSSPEYVRMSLAAAMTLGLAPGEFYRGARLGCINLLLTYPGGCKANCSYCGLAREKRIDRFDPTYEKFIRVSWKAWPLDLVLERCNQAPDWVDRVCISTITHPRGKQDTLTVAKAVKEKTGMLLSILISPTLSSKEDLVAMKEVGASHVGIAVDLATPELFAQNRGKPVKGPHKWERYWQAFEWAAEIFGKDHFGSHLIHGLGEEERELIAAFQRVRDLGGETHLFCFFPERFSALAQRPQPPAPGYRRVQLARYLIDNDLARFEEMAFDGQGRVLDFGAPPGVVEEAISGGKPFMTSGCPNKKGEVACNRPFGNEKPGPDLRNYPFELCSADITLVRAQLKEY